MDIRNIFKKNDPLGPSADAGEPSVDGMDLEDNEAKRKKQSIFLLGGASVFGLAALLWILDDGEGSEGDETADSGEEVIQTAALVNGAQGEQEWLAISEQRLGDTDRKVNSLGGQVNRIDQLEEQIRDLQTEKVTNERDGIQTLQAYDSENARLKAELAEAKAAQLQIANEAPLYGGPGGPGGPGYTRTSGDPSGGSFQKAVKMVNFDDGESSEGSSLGDLELSDSKNYLPANSYATAKVIVGVDASTGVNSQTDPLPVMLRITTPARSAYGSGRILSTDVVGCVINGAARGDLSAEKVYVKLQKMTCEQPGGRYAVSKVKGFIAFGGKAGVRGRVVSREGGLATQALIAGTLSGFGRGFSANANSVFSGTNISTDGERDKLSTGDILQGGLGSGVAQAGDTVSQYLIERAEQYQPVIDMPTGLDVQVVFLDGVLVRK